jgi:hypothetical protein
MVQHHDAPRFLAALTADPYPLVAEMRPHACQPRREVGPDWEIAMEEALWHRTRAPRQRGVASNPRTPLVVLHRVARDPEPAVQLAVARNPVTLADLLAMLAQDTAWLVRMWVARHSAASPVKLLPMTVPGMALIAWIHYIIIQEWRHSWIALFFLWWPIPLLTAAFVHIE